jgi:hypothetical protein
VHVEYAEYAEYVKNAEYYLLFVLKHILHIVQILVTHDAQNMAPLDTLRLKKSNTPHRVTFVFTSLS